jgi:peptidoglycan/xylan/chitin deacetylase (PgdA/CDA1 family)
VELANGPRSRPEVALTFHGAGDPTLAREVLTVAESAGAQVTVLAVGRWLAGHRDLARRIVGGGHELGNHTWTHPALAELGPAAVATEIERCRDLIEELTGSPGAHFRQSQGQHSTPLVRRLAGRAGYPVCLSYDVDSLDWTDPGPAAIRASVAAGVRPGSVVSLHLGHPGTLLALPDVLADLRRRGLRPVTASTLLTA